MYGGLRVITTRGTISRRDLLNSYLEVIPFWMHMYMDGASSYINARLKVLSFLFLRNKTSQVDRKRKMHLELNLANFLTNSSKIDGHLETTSSRRLSLHRASYFLDFLSFLSFLFAQT